MFVQTSLFVLSVNIYLATAIQCFDCKLPDSVDITEMDIDQVEELFRSSTCNLGSYIAGGDERIFCNAVSVDADGNMAFPPTVTKSVTATGPIEPEQTVSSNGLMINTHVSNFDIYGINSHEPENNPCGLVRNHVECADADHSDWATICSCRDWPGCSGAGDTKSTFCYIFISFVLSFLSY